MKKATSFSSNNKQCTRISVLSVSGVRPTPIGVIILPLGSVIIHCSILVKVSLSATKSGTQIVSFTSLVLTSGEAKTAPSS